MDTLSEMLCTYDCSDRSILNNQFMSVLIKELRKSKIRRPDIVLTGGVLLLKHESGNEIWNLYEQMAVAALDSGKIDLADVYVNKLVKQFPDSLRVKRLEGMIMEYEGEYTEALELYATLLSQKPSNIMIMKRKACVYKAKGDLKSLADELNAILTLYPSEAASWLELGEIHLAQCNYEESAHCFEELILLEPMNAVYHVRLAEVYFTLGGVNNLLASRKHYSMSLTTQGPQFNIRALYGLVAACKGVSAGDINDSSSSSSSSNHDNAVNTELLRWAKSQLELLLESKTNSTDSPLAVVASSIV